MCVQLLNFSIDGNALSLQVDYICWSFSSISLRCAVHSSRFDVAPPESQLRVIYNWTVQVLVRLFNKVVVRFSWLGDLFWGWVATGSWFLTELEQSLLLVAIG